MSADTSPWSPGKPRSPWLAAADLFDPPVDPYALDPFGWARDILGAHLWSRMRQVAESVRDNPKTAVRSGHGIGKTATAAIIVLWFLDTHTDSRVISTATKWSQVESLLWHEVNQMHARGARRPQSAGRPVFQTSPLKTKLELPDGRYGIGLSSKPENSESFAGHHAEHLLVIYDEASGIHKSIFEVGEGYLTTDGSRALLIGNPTRVQGEFYAAFNARRSDYKTFHISALESPAITGEPVPDDLRRKLTGKAWVEGRLAAWGEDHPLYQVRVLGNFPDLTTDTVIGLGAVEDAQDRELPADSRVDLVVIGGDIARFGDDETVITERVGQRIRIVETYVGQGPPAITATGAQDGDIVATAGRIAHHARQHPQPHVRIVVDDVGLGGGVTDILRNEGFEVTAFNAGAQAFSPGQFPNRRSELWFQAAAQLEDIDLDDDEQLLADLTAPKFGYDLKLRRVVEPKPETKKRLGRSPDRGDGVLLTLVPAQSMGAVAGLSPVEARARRRGQARPDRPRSDDEWLTQPM